MAEGAPHADDPGLDAATEAHLRRFLEAMLAENARINLTAIRSPELAWPLHVLDALVLLPMLDELAADSLIDLGSGCGVPGVPLAIARPALRVTLVDATRKKVEALERIIEAVAVANVTAVWGRAEALAHDAAYRERSDVLAARAVAQTPLLLEFSAGFVRPGGRLLLMKSVQGAEQEERDGRGAARRCALRHVETRRYALPAEHGERAVLIYEKSGRLDPGLPRPPGAASQRPLA